MQVPLAYMQSAVTEPRSNSKPCSRMSTALDCERGCAKSHPNNFNVTWHISYQQLSSNRILKQAQQAANTQHMYGVEDVTASKLLASRALTHTSWCSSLGRGNQRQPCNGGCLPQHQVVCKLCTHGHVAVLHCVTASHRHIRRICHRFGIFIARSTCGDGLLCPIPQVNGPSTCQTPCCVHGSQCSSTTMLISFAQAKLSPFLKNGSSVLTKQMNARTRLVTLHRSWLPWSHIWMPWSNTSRYDMLLVVQCQHRESADPCGLTTAVVW